RAVWQRARTSDKRIGRPDNQMLLFPSHPCLPTSGYFITLASGGLGLQQLSDRRETAAVLRGNALTGKRFLRLARAIARVALPAIVREFLREIRHHAVARHLGND